MNDPLTLATERWRKCFTLLSYFAKRAVVFVFVYQFNFCSRSTVVCPIIDVISDETFEFLVGSDMTYGGFNWKLNFRWYPVPKREMDRRNGDRSIPLR